MSLDTERPTLPGFDPLSEEFLRDPFPTWSRAQREAPVFFYPEMNFWVLTRFDDVMAAATDHATFSSRAVGVVPAPPELQDRLPRGFFEHSLVAIDPPEHTVVRKAANRGFTRPRVAAMEARMTAIAHELIDRFVDDGRCDLMRQYCYQLSLRTIASLVGLDDSDEHLERYRQWTEDMFSLMTPESKDDVDPEAVARPMDPRVLHDHWTGISEAAEYFQGLIDDRRAHPGDDLLTTLVQARDGDEPALSDVDIITHVQEIIAAGNDTTANLIGSLLFYLSQESQGLDALKANPELIPAAVEEGLRRRGSSIGMFRLTTRDVEMSGVTIPQGSLVFLGFQAAGHDPDHFPAPRTVDIHRPNAAEHLSFGRGRHFCMGAPLARLEARVGLEVLLARIPELEIVPGQELTFLPVLTVSMLEGLQARWPVTPSTTPVI